MESERRARGALSVSFFQPSSLPPVHPVDAVPCSVNTSAIGFMAQGASNPLATLELIGAAETAKILGVVPSCLSNQARRGRFLIEPAVTTVDGRKFWHRPDVVRAAQLLAAKNETAPTATP